MPTKRVMKPRGLKGRWQAVNNMWDRLAPAMIEAGLLTPLDIPAFMLMLHSYDMATDALDAMHAGKGAYRLTRHDENNVERKDPHLQIYRDQSAAFRAWCSEFGMTPASRRKLIDMLKKDEGLDDLDKLNELFRGRRVAK